MEDFLCKLITVVSSVIKAPSLRTQRIPLSSDNANNTGGYYILTRFSVPLLVWQSILDRMSQSSWKKLKKSKLQMKAARPVKCVSAAFCAIPTILGLMWNGTTSELSWACPFTEGRKANSLNLTTDYHILTPILILLISVLLSYSLLFTSITENPYLIRLL